MTDSTLLVIHPAGSYEHAEEDEQDNRDKKTQANADVPGDQTGDGKTVTALTFGTKFFATNVTGDHSNNAGQEGEDS